MDKYWDWNKKKVLITGAGGFVGSNASLFFDKLGCDVTAVISTQTSERKLKTNLDNNNIKLVTVDLLNQNEAITFMEKQDVVLHFAARAGNLGYKKLKSAELYSQNIKINANIFEAASLCNIEALLFASSTDIYDNAISGILTEKTPINIDWEHDIDGYRLAKWASELALREYHKQFGMNCIIVRPANLYGPRDKFFDPQQMGFVPSIMRKAFVEKKSIEIWGDGNQIRSFLYIDDFLNACRLLIEKGVYNTPVNIASKNTVTLNEVAELVKNIANDNIEIILDKSKPSGELMRVFNSKFLESLIGDYELTNLKDGILKTTEFLKNISTN